MADRPLVSQDSLKPTRKVGMGTAYGAMIGVVIAWLLAQNGVEMPPEVAIAVGTLLGNASNFVGVWLAKDREG